jgi:hypothetical protein
MLATSTASGHKSKYVSAWLHALIHRNDLPLSSTIFLFVNNSLHPKANGVFDIESNKDDYVGSYCNAGSLPLIALV